MNSFSILLNLIEEEINDADRYANLALKMKNENPMLSNLFKTLSTEELSHEKRLSEALTQITSEMKKADEYSEGYKLMYDFMNSKRIESLAKVKVLQSML